MAAAAGLLALASVPKATSQYGINWLGYDAGLTDIGAMGVA